MGIEAARIWKTSKICNWVMNRPFITEQVVRTISWIYVCPGEQEWWGFFVCFYNYLPAFQLLTCAFPYYQLQRETALNPRAQASYDRLLPRLSLLQLIELVEWFNHMAAVCVSMSGWEWTVSLKLSPGFTEYLLMCAFLYLALNQSDCWVINTGRGH